MAARAARVPSRVAVDGYIAGMGRLKAKKGPRRVRNPLVAVSGVPISERVTACPRCGNDDDGEVGGLGCCGAITAECYACAQDGWDDDDEPVNPRESYEWYVATGKRFRAATHICG
jgi:hypothetical protein